MTVNILNNTHNPLNILAETPAFAHCTVISIKKETEQKTQGKVDEEKYRPVKSVINQKTTGGRKEAPNMI
jgi:hypothetical protein